jgi:hypothetical protein
LSLESGGWFCVGAFWQESGFSRLEDILAFHLLLRNYTIVLLLMPFARTMLQ